MKHYDKYKPSGIEWIGVVPEHWEVRRLKTLCKDIRNGYVGPTRDLYVDEGVPYIQSVHIKDGKILFEREEYYVTEEWAKKHPKIRKGNIVVVQTGDIGQIALVDEKYDQCNCHALIILDVDNDVISSDFLSLYLKSNIGKELMLLTKTGALLPHLNSTQIGDTRTILPPLPEQQAIAAYLDRKCGEIDNAIATQQKRIELLQELRQKVITNAVTRGINPNAPMKDSGVEWIGMVPEHWEVMNLKHTVNGINDVNHYMPNDVSYGYPYIMTGDLKEYASEINFDDCKQISKTDFDELTIKCRTKKGDIIFARYATIGTVCYVDIDKDFVVSYSCVTINPSKQLNGKFLFYYLKSDSFYEGVSQNINSNTQGNVGIESLKATKICIPTLPEQQEIVSYIEKEIDKIDKQVAKANHQIELLQELKQSIITEVVTGKRKVC